MTTQVLMSSSVLSSDQVVVNAQHPVETTPTSDSSTSVAVQARKLPYQENHQVELMHLQAEIEALLQHLQTLKQQRLSEFGEEHELDEPVEANLVASR
jgi:hypothetical protein